MRWLKLYVSLLDDFEFNALPETAQLHLIKLWLAAAECGGTVDDEAQSEFRIRAKSSVSWELLASTGFLVRIRTDSYGISRNRGLEERRLEEKREENKPPPRRTARRSIVEPLPGFLRAWSEYPHFKQRSSKTKSAEVWRKCKLEPLTEGVLAWIGALRNDEAVRDGGQYVPAMDRWLSKHDFSDSPPSGGGSGIFSGYDEAEIDRLLGD
jgi:hypothetical protein